MRRLLTGFVVAAIAAVVPTLALAGNQEVAEQIAHNLRHSGQMSDYKIGVKYQDGTAWLLGRVSSEEQMNTALRLTFQISSVNRVVNDLTVAGSRQLSLRRASRRDACAAAARSAILSAARRLTPRRPSGQGGSVWQSGCNRPRMRSQQGYADRVPSSYTQASVRAGRRRGAAADAGVSTSEAGSRWSSWRSADGDDAAEHAGPDGAQRRPVADVHGGQQPGRRGAGPLRPALHAQLCLAKLCGLSKLRRRDLSEAVFADGLAVHRPVLSVSPGSAGMAESDLGMG